jgi:hypothetical protein
VLGQQVIIQVWITSQFGVLSKRPSCSDEGFCFITALSSPPSLGCKARFREVLSLLPSKHPFHALQVPPRLRGNRQTSCDAAGCATNVSSVRAAAGTGSGAGERIWTVPPSPRLHIRNPKPEYRNQAPQLLLESWATVPDSRVHLVSTTMRQAGRGAKERGLQAAERSTWLAIPGIPACSSLARFCSLKAALLRRVVLTRSAPDRCNSAVPFACRTITCYDNRHRRS